MFEYIQPNNINNCKYKSSMQWINYFSRIDKVRKNISKKQYCGKNSTGNLWMGEPIFFFPPWRIASLLLQWNGKINIPSLKYSDEMKRGMMHLFSSKFSANAYFCVFMAHYQWEEIGYLNSLETIPTFSWILNSSLLFLIELVYISDMYLKVLKISSR